VPLLSPRLQRLWARKDLRRLILRLLRIEFIVSLKSALLIHISSLSCELSTQKKQKLDPVRSLLMYSLIASSASASALSNSLFLRYSLLVAKYKRESEALVRAVALITLCRPQIRSSPVAALKQSYRRRIASLPLDLCVLRQGRRYRQCLLSRRGG